MANDFDQFPIYDKLVDEQSNKLSSIWIGAMSTFFQNLIGYLSQNGVFLPSLTTAQRDAIQNPQPGQIIYNVTAGSAQYFKVNTWTSI